MPGCVRLTILHTLQAVGELAEGPTHAMLDLLLAAQTTGVGAHSVDGGAITATQLLPLMELACSAQNLTLNPMVQLHDLMPSKASAS